MPARATLVLLMGVVVGCWADFPDERIKKVEAGIDRHFPPDVVRGDLAKCVPNALLACTPDKKGIIACAQSGFGTVTAVCDPFQCVDPSHLCNGCTPGTPPTCSGSSLVTCNSIGYKTTTTCSKGCSGGACL